MLRVSKVRCSLFRCMESGVSNGMFQKAQLRQLRLKGIVSTQALLALSSTRYAPWMTKLGKKWGRIDIKCCCFFGRCPIEMFHEMSHPDCTWTFGLRLRSLKIKPLKLRCSTVGRLSLEDGLLVGKMRMDNGWSKLCQKFNLKYLFYVSSEYSCKQVSVSAKMIH